MIEICMIHYNKDKNESKRTVLRKLQETILGGSMVNKRINKQNEQINKMSKETRISHRKS